MSIGAKQMLMTIAVADTVYGLRARDVLDIGEAGGITPVPGAPPFVLGVCTRKGAVVPVLSVGQRLGLQLPATAGPTQVAFVQHGDDVTGLAIDRAVGFLEVADEEITPSPSVMAAAEAPWFDGIVSTAEGRLAALLNLDILLEFEISDAARERMDAYAASAGEYALPPEAQETGDLYIVADVGEASFCFAAAIVDEVAPKTAPERRGDLPPHVIGWLELPRSVAAVYSLRSRFALPGNDDDARYVLCAAGEDTVAFAVDSINEIIAVAGSDRHPPPLMLGDIDSEGIEALVVRPESRQVIAALDPSALLGQSKLGEAPPGRNSEMQETQLQQTSSTDLELLLFHLGNHLLALPTSAVREVLSRPPISWVPLAPPDIAGVFHLRGEVVPAMDLLSRFADSDRPDEEAEVVIVLEARGNPVGLLAHALHEIRRVPMNELSPPPAVVQGPGEGLLSGIVEGRSGEGVLVLSPELLLGGPATGE